MLEARLRSDRLALAAALLLTLCGALAAVVVPPLTPVSMREEASDMVTVLERRAA